MALPAGLRLGPYEIVSALGAGGMGEVYRAKDTKLGRDVALKVLPEEFFEDRERVARFEREARSLASLNHPGIAAVHSFDEASGRHLLVMELVEGETLAERIARGALPLRQVAALGEKIASALEAAHRKGIVHRDLKPGNVMVTTTGVKLLDFGLAKMRAPRKADESETSAPTAAKDVTRDGVILGTPSYMAPEQLEGKEADARTDLFALGAVLYEMATGRKAFAGPSEASLISAILSSDPPPISSLRPETPPALDRLVRTCLAKDPDARWQSAGDVARELKWIAEESVAGAVAAAAHRGRGGLRERLAWAVAVAAVLFGALSAYLPRRPVAPGELTRFAIGPPSGQGFLPIVELSPDARRIAFLLQDEGGKNSIGLRSLDNLEIRRLPGTEDARGMFWSPDGREIAFFADGRLKRMGAEGGPARTICESAGGFSGAWSPRGTILFTKDFGEPIVAVPATGGTPEPATALDGTGGTSPISIPPSFPTGGTSSSWRATSTRRRRPSSSPRSIRRTSAGSSMRTPPPSLPIPAIFSSRATTPFSRGGSIREGWSSPGNPPPRSSRSATGPKTTFSRSRRLETGWRTCPGSCGGGSSGWTGRGASSPPSAKPGGTRTSAFRRTDEGSPWRFETRRTGRTRMSGSWTRRAERAPASPSSGRMSSTPRGFRTASVSSTSPTGSAYYDLYERPAGGGAEKILLRTKQDKVLPTVSPDGRHLLVSIPVRGNHTRVLIPLPGPGDPVPLSAGTRFSEEHAEFSPDSRWTSFESGESGQREVYVQPLAGGPKRQVSIGGGQLPVWNRKGSELFYVARDGMLMSVSVRPGADRFEIGEPQPLFLLRLGTTGEIQLHRHPYDVSPDGQRFLVIRRAPDAEADSAVVVTNWTAVLGRSR